MIKKCIGCEQELPATLEFFYKNSTAKCGLMARCKKCAAEVNSSWRRANYDKMRQYVKDWHISNTYRVSEIKRNWYIRNKEAVKEKAALSKDEINRRRREYAKRNPHIRLHMNVSREVRKSLILGKNGWSWEELLGYSREQLSSHLEKQFTKGMTWDNYGKYWVIDHIVPLSNFPKAKSKGDPNLHAAWALSNLRPLNRKENEEKSDKRIFLL